MGGAVSSGRDNNELIDNLMSGNYIRTRAVERVFRVLDRADFMTHEVRDQAYKDLAWRNGPLHMSAPCIYSEVMEGLELRPGLSFLNVGSGTGYLSTLVGLMIGSTGISHGIEVHPTVLEYASKKLSQFIENSPTLDEFDFCEPKYYLGNALCVAPLQAAYDRVYCGARCPEEYENYFKQFIKVGGILVMPLNDKLMQVKRVSETEWESRSLLGVSFALLRVPTADERTQLVKLEELTPPRLQSLCRSAIRGALRDSLLRRSPDLRECPRRRPPARKSGPRRICIPLEDDSDVEGLFALHQLDRTNGGTEMNALLGLVLSLGQSRVAGALRFDAGDSTDDDDDRPDDLDDDDRPAYVDDDDDDDDDMDDSNDRNEDDDDDIDDASPFLLSSFSLNESSGTSDATPASAAEEAPATRRLRSRTIRLPGAAPPPAAAAMPPPASPAPPAPATSTRTLRSNSAGSAEMRPPARRAAAKASGSQPAPRPSKSSAKAASKATTSRTRDAKAAEPKTIATRSSTRASASTSKATRSRSSESSKSRATPRSDEARSPAPRASGSRTGGYRTRSKSAKWSPDADDVPGEVEIHLRKSRAGASTSAAADMEWEGPGLARRGADRPQPTTTTTTTKRHKLDSGVGENTPSSASASSSPPAHRDSDLAEHSRSDSLTNDSGARDVGGRRRRQKRRLCRSGRRSSSSEASGSESGGAAATRRRVKRRAASGGGGRGGGGGGGRGERDDDSDEERLPEEGDPDFDPLGPRRPPGGGPHARQVRLSQCMKQGVKELPLPPALKKFLNYGRCIQL